MHPRPVGKAHQFGKGDRLVSPTWTVFAAKRTDAGGACQYSAANATSRALICSAASSAAIPFRSEPLEAAVAEVLGTFSVVVRVMRMRPIST
jgi:hypothetical protein